MNIFINVTYRESQNSPIKKELYLNKSLSSVKETYIKRGFQLQNEASEEIKTNHFKIRVGR